jgi:hypothetical protein
MSRPVNNKESPLSISFPMSAPNGRLPGSTSADLSKQQSITASSCDKPVADILIFIEMELELDGARICMHYPLIYRHSIALPRGLIRKLSGTSEWHRLSTLSCLCRVQTRI